MNHFRGVLATITVGTLLTGLVPTQAAADELHGRWIKGRILEAYHRLGGHPALGDALTDELDAGRGGKFQVFEHLSSIYWHPLVDKGTAHQVKGDIRKKWGDWNWENGALRYPVTDELSTPDGNGRFNHLEGGSVYWTPRTKAQVVKGRIRDRWANQGWELGELGYPTTDEVSISGGRGRFNHFEGGSIYWTPETGANIVKGRVRDYWGSRGWEEGIHGYPTGEEFNAPRRGRQQNFEKLNIQWVPQNNSRLPFGDTSGWGDYNQYYRIMPENGRWTPEAIAAEFTQNFDAYFTFTGCSSVITVGDKCALNTVAGDQEVEISAVTRDGFSFKSLPGHLEGEGRTISFRFYRHTLPSGEADIFMEVRAWGPAGGASRLGIFNSATFARWAWSNLSNNLRSRVHSSSIDYATGDKGFGAVRAKRSLEENHRQFIEPTQDAEEVDVDATLNKWGILQILPSINPDKPFEEEGVPTSLIEEALQEKKITNY